MKNRGTNASRSGRHDNSQSSLTPTKIARMISIQNHLTLVALRQGKGNAFMVASLLRSTYLAHFLMERVGDDKVLRTLLDAERHLKAVADQAQGTEGWSIPESHCLAIQDVLLLHDDQLLSLPFHTVERAKRRLWAILDSNRFPDIAADRA